MANSFRKRSPIIYDSSEVPFIRDLDKTEVNHNGIILENENLVIISPEEFHKKHPVPMQEFTLMDELEAGVNLREIPCGTMLDSDDNLDYAVNDTAEETLLKQLNSDNNE